MDEFRATFSELVELGFFTQGLLLPNGWEVIRHVLDKETGNDLGEDVVLTILEQGTLFLEYAGPDELDHFAAALVLLAERMETPLTLFAKAGLCCPLAALLECELSENVTLDLLTLFRILLEDCQIVEYCNAESLTGTLLDILDLFSDKGVRIPATTLECITLLLPLVKLSDDASLQIFELFGHFFKKDAMLYVATLRAFKVLIAEHPVCSSLFTPTGFVDVLSELLLDEIELIRRKAAKLLTFLSERQYLEFPNKKLQDTMVQVNQKRKKQNVTLS